MPVKPNAVDDSASFFETDAINGNILDNDVAGSNGKKILNFFDGERVDAKTPGVITTIEGEHGTFFVKADGSYSYELHASEKVGFEAGESLFEHISYKISDGGGNTDTAVFNLEIKGVTSKPVAVDDHLSFSEDDAISGNLLSNEINPGGSTLYLRFFDGVRVDAKSGPAHETIVQGDYGTFKLQPDGSFTYELDHSLDAVQNLGAGEHLTERVSYKMADAAGHTDVGVLDLTINGSDAPLLS